MFEEQSGRARRVVDPPRSVVVDVGRWMPPTRIRWGAATPLWMRTRGVPLSDRVPARLVEWWVTSAGDWYGRCQVTLRVDGEDVSLDQLIPESAIRPADTTSER